MIARTRWGRALAVLLSIGVSQLAVPAVQAATPSSEGHLVGTADIARRLVANARTREERVKLFQDALGTKEAREKARAMGADPDRLRAAVPHLTDRELAELSARAAQVKDVAAGHRGGDGNGALVLIGVVLLLAGIVAIAAAAGDYYEDEYWDDCWCY